ncbi:uncharacterized protein LOC113125269 [Mastacembelus armatus]|uniref:uncharacterized protein LOC113125269 n=1 Tax=Mastacembelus armatus TaxID=205130 RepID=UPI000E456F94|nr:uncharacterized protein LOC113125269 [Mastacembelus armatus]
MAQKTQLSVEVGDKQSSTPHKSVNLEQDLKQQHAVPDTLAKSSATVSTPTDSPQEKSKKVSWWRRWLFLKKKTKKVTPLKEKAQGTNLPSSCATGEILGTISDSKGGETGVQEASPTTDPPVSTEIHTRKKKSKKRAFYWFHCKVKSLLDADHEAEKNFNLDKKSTEDEPNKTNLNDNSSENNSKIYNDEVNTLVTAEIGIPIPPESTPCGHGGRLKDNSNNTDLWKNISGNLTNQFSSCNTKKVSRKELSHLGFPNLAQTCYMNSALQGLLTLNHFIQEVHNQEKTWQFHAKCQLIRGLAEVGVCRFSNNKAEKKSALTAFKQTVAEYNSEFEDNRQKDAHEFLSCVLDLLRSLSFELHTAAADMGISYTCPVTAHMAFQMLSTRTCKGCGIQSMREEEYINLSLDLVPGGSVSQCLQEYLKEEQLEYRCECGAEESSQQQSFLTLPNVLILHLKRFRFTPLFNLEKVTSPVILSKELVLNPESSITTQTTTHYSLVSIISHLGSTAHSGHYICDGVYREEPDKMTAHWLTYNDKNVSETTCASVCHQRQKTAYLLFYEKQPSLEPQSADLQPQNPTRSTASLKALLSQPPPLKSLSLRCQPQTPSWSTPNLKAPLCRPPPSKPLSLGCQLQNLSWSTPSLKAPLCQPPPSKPLSLGCQLQNLSWSTPSLKAPLCQPPPSKPLSLGCQLQNLSWSTPSLKAPLCQPPPSKPLSLGCQLQNLSWSTPSLKAPLCQPPPSKPLSLGCQLQNLSWSTPSLKAPLCQPPPSKPLSLGCQLQNLSWSTPSLKAPLCQPPPSKPLSLGCQPQKPSWSTPSLKALFCRPPPSKPLSLGCQPQKPSWSTPSLKALFCRPPPSKPLSLGCQLQNLTWSTPSLKALFCRPPPSKPLSLGCQPQNPTLSNTSFHAPALLTTTLSAPALFTDKDLREDTDHWLTYNGLSTAYCPESSSFLSLYQSHRVAFST